jgi:hypothetical protein
VLQHALAKTMMMTYYEIAGVYEKPIALRILKRTVAMAGAKLIINYLKVKKNIFAKNQLRLFASAYKHAVTCG